MGVKSAIGVGAAAVLALAALAGCGQETEKTRDHFLAGMTLEEASKVMKDDVSRVYQFIPREEGGDPIDNNLHDDASPDWTIIAGCSSEPYVEDSDWVELAVWPNELIDDETYQDIIEGAYRGAISCAWIKDGMEAGPPEVPKR